MENNCEWQHCLHFLIAYSDPLLWGKKDRDPSVYVHRIVTNPDFRGNHFVKNITTWAKEHAKTMGKKFVRMDTWAENQKLIDYYIACGFHYVGDVTPIKTEGLPKHYVGISLSLFEMEV